MSDSVPFCNRPHSCVVLLRRCARVRVDPGPLGGFVGLPAHGATFMLSGLLLSSRAWRRAISVAFSNASTGCEGTEPIPKCGGDTTRTVNRPVLSIDFVGGGIAPCIGALLRARPRGVALGMSFPRGRTDMNGLRGRLLVMMQHAFSVVFWCGPERQQSGLAVLEEGHRAMRR